MARYKVNLKFKDDGESLNDVIIELLRRELDRRVNNTYRELPLCNNNFYLKRENDDLQ